MYGNVCAYENERAWGQRERKSVLQHGHEYNDDETETVLFSVAEIAALPIFDASNGRTSKDINQPDWKKKISYNI